MQAKDHSVSQEVKTKYSTQQHKEHALYIRFHRTEIPICILTYLLHVSLCSSVGALRTLSQYQSELCELSQLAWRGLEESKILFMEEDIPQHALELSVKTGLFSQVRHDFLHASVHEQVNLQN